MRISQSSVAAVAGFLLGVLWFPEADVAASGGISEVVLDPPSLNLRVNSRNGEISGQQRLNVGISYSGSIPGHLSCRKVRWIELHALSDDGGAKDVTLASKSVGADDDGACSFDAASTRFQVAPLSENEIRSFCSSGTSRTSGEGPIRRRIEVLLYGPGGEVPNNRVSLQLVDLFTNVACEEDRSTLIAANRAPARRPHGDPPRHSAHATPVNQVKDLAAPATAKENLDSAYQELSASYASYVANYEVYRKKRDYCLSRSYTLVDQAAAGCKDTDTWHACKQEVISVCMGVTVNNLAAAKKKVETDAANVQTKAEKLSEEVPDLSKE